MMQHPRLFGLSGLANLHGQWGWLMLLGIATLILGGLAISYSVVATFLTVTVLGILLVLGGAMLIIHGLVTRQWRGFWLNLLVGVLYALAGAVLLANPAIAAMTLTLFAAAFFLASGLFRLIGALAQRFEGWGGVAFSGIISLALGVLIWMQWPVSGWYMIGIFLGVDLLLIGVTLLFVAWQARQTNPGDRSNPPSA